MNESSEKESSNSGSDGSISSEGEKIILYNCIEILIAVYNVYKYNYT